MEFFSAFSQDIIELSSKKSNCVKLCYDCGLTPWFNRLIRRRGDTSVCIIMPIELIV